MSKGEKTVWAIWCPQCEAFYRVNPRQEWRGNHCSRCGLVNKKYNAVKVCEKNLEDEPK